MFSIEDIKLQVKAARLADKYSGAKDSRFLCDVLELKLSETIAELERVNKMLCELTPSGSEYCNDSDRCIEYIKDRITTADRLAIAQAKKNKEAIAE
jgi:hypothetical protein